MKVITSINHPALALYALVCFALAPQARATCQEGCLANSSTVLGEDALINDTGFENTAIGFHALFSQVSTEGNTAIGWEALASTTGGSFNTAIGFGALEANSTGFGNTAIGVTALDFNTAGFSNTATGGSALALNRTGSSNTATGTDALFSNKDGNENTATGVNALHANSTGNSNTAIGFGALSNNKHGSNNVAIGSSAGSALTTGDNNIDIGNAGVGREANTIRIGTVGTQNATFIAGISGATVPTGVPVIVDATGHLGTTTSSARFKEAIKPMDKASEAILDLKPVTFRYKYDFDPDGIPQFGLVAEDVAKVDAHLVAKDDQGKPYSVRYDAVNAMLLNEFLKEHRKVQDLEANAEHQQKQIEALTAGLQKVGAELQLSKAAPQTVANQ
jgi:hypothetical protein